MRQMTNDEINECTARQECAYLILGVMLACDQRRFLMERLGVWGRR